MFAVISTLMENLQVATITTSTNVAGQNVTVYLIDNSSRADITAVAFPSTTGKATVRTQKTTTSYATTNSLVYNYTAACTGVCAVFVNQSTDKTNSAIIIAKIAELVAD